MKQKIDYIVTDAIDSDASYIAKLEKECFSAPWSLAQITEEISKNNVIFLVSKTENDFCGYISGQLILDEFYISNVAVFEEFRCQGIASSLITELINRLEKTDCSFATLEVRQSNINARKVYEKFGFMELGIRKDFYTAPKENACIYTLYFNNESRCQ